MAAVEKASESVRAVGRALEILSAFSPVDFELSPGELVKRVDLSRPTMYRLLHTLEVNGYLVSSGDPQKFRLGPQVARLAHVWMSSNDPAAAALPMMRRVWEVSNETVGLFVREGDSRICVAELVSPHPLSFRRGVGFHNSLISGASGKAIAAHSALDARQLRQLTQDAQIDVAAYTKELERTRKRGYAVSQDEQIRGATSIAAPFFDASGEVVGSLALYGPSVRIDAKAVTSYANLLMSEASHISRSLGFQPDETGL
ncbi:IclR family transcriptional regulator [Pusillimonas noertemannii]|uniref:IclR family transcriptional regulator n=1 Tax=Pusillimonas noertemannii TaxID=305977 RepID=A0A2U1CKZ1_9BURK|nr:IclR family transcriptional regulator [Pusillimonas noertemannii]NYT69211.1 IclR family transcriptional regulator [Pusillimonas noertemannii]PVY61680.1 IclR family transcriptional regulator [Pusillimonas noertemannii]TFL09621.1 IclR family transcriptional regulator [Pusillimonas noertemannii]